MDIDAFVANWASTRGIPALVTGIHRTTQDGSETTSHEHVAHPRSYTDSQFGIGSITKSMTALGVLSLADNDAIALDDPIADYLDWEEKTDDPVKIRHLLSHTSGRPSDFALSHVILQDMDVTDDDTAFESFDDVLSFANDYPAELCREPGTTYCYYNTGYVLLGLLIETVSNQSYNEYIRETVLTPLGMDDSTFIDEELGSTPPFYRFSSGLIPVEPAASPVINPAGGLFCTCEDLVRYGRMLQNRGTLDGEQIFTDDIIDRLLDPVAAIEDVDDLDYAGSPVGVGTWDAEYALGIEQKTVNGTTVIGHHGDLGYSEAQLTITDNAVVASLANRVVDDGGLHNFNLCLHDIVNGDEIQEPYYTTTGRLDTLTGTYAIPTFDNYTVTVERNGGHLEYSSDVLGDGILIPDGVDDSEHWFSEPRDDGTEQRHRFVKPDDGPTQLFLERHGFRKTDD